MAHTDIFDKAGGVFSNPVPDLNGYTYITFVSSTKGDSSNELVDVLNCRAPANKIDIEENVDCDISRSLANDFIIAVFGYAPIRITITGMDLFAGPCGRPDKADKSKAIQQFFDENNPYLHKDKRLAVTLSGSSDSYVCVPTALRRTLDRSGNATGPLGVGSYVLSLIGVKNTK